MVAFARNGESIEVTIPKNLKIIEVQSSKLQDIDISKEAIMKMGAINRVASKIDISSAV